MSRDQRSALASRWNTAEGKSRVVAVVKALCAGRELSRLGFLEQHEGRWDLRGIMLPSPQVRGELIFQSSILEQISGRQTFKRVSVKNVDLSFCHFGGSAWHRCRFDNVSLAGSNLQGTGFWACGFDNVVFDKTDLRDTVLAGEYGRETCTYTRVSFVRAKFPTHVMGFGLFDGCDFSNADMEGTDFDGMRFLRCTFGGLVDNAFFRRHVRYTKLPTFPWQRVDLSDFENTMEGVDFSQANLRGVVFDCIDLTRCRLPDDGNHLLLRRQQEVIRRAIRAIEGTWSGSESGDALSLLDVMYVTPKPHSPLTREMADYPHLLVNRLDFVDWLGEQCGNKLFSLLESISVNLDY